MNCSGDRLTATRTVIRPLRGIHAGATQHQPTNGADKPRLLGHRNKLGRRNHTAFAMRPAHQCLESRDTAALQIDQRLIVGLQHIAFDRGTQIDLDPAARLQRAHPFQPQRN